MQALLAVSLLQARQSPCSPRTQTGHRYSNNPAGTRPRDLQASGQPHARSAPPKEEKLGPGHHMALSKARGLTLGGTPSPRHQRGAKRISQEALNT